MQILLTGNHGFIGRVIESRLQAEGHQVTGFDLREGKDIRNVSTLIQAGRNCEAVVHLAALLGNSDAESAEDVTRTNLIGTWNVLEAARLNAFRRVIFMSSVDALGIFKGEASPAYFPIDDDHPCTPTTPYGISKKLAEELCHTFSQINNCATICLRPPGVWDASTYLQIIENRRKRPEYEWDPYWEYGAFIDVRDLAALVVKCLQSDSTGYGCYLVSSDDITTSGMTSIELTRKIHPHVEWKGKDGFEDNPYRSLLDCHRVKQAFGWVPEFSWRRFIEDRSFSQ